MARILAPDDAGIREAAFALRAGRLVVFPTETVYGVGAHALDPAAVARIFAAKARPPDNPLIVHVPDAAAARALCATWPERAERLAAAFWPGPMTLVLPRAPHVPDVTTGGLESVAVRVPEDPVALALLREAAVPVAAPSANRSGRPSPTRVEDAAADLGDAVAAYLDGGPTRVGLESTVVSLLSGAPRVLRVGGLTLEDLRRVEPDAALGGAGGEDAASPGTRHRHYAPRARVVLAPGEMLVARADALRREGLRVAIVASREGAPPGPDVRVPGARDDGGAWSRALFALLRDLEGEGYDAIVVEEVPERGLGRAVMDRLRRAAEGTPGDATGADPSRSARR